ncbi:MAG: hypothetical protein ACYC1D_14880 [Acidimicrobiales bacterium]
MTTETRDLRSARRTATAVCVVAAPLLVGVGRALVPTLKDDKASTTIPAVVAHLSAGRAELILAVFGLVLVPFFVLGLYRLVNRRTPVLAGVGCVIGLVGWTMAPVVTAGHALAYEVARLGGNPAIYDRFLHNGAVNALTVVFIVGHVLGTLLLGVALWRTRVVPRWAAAAVVVGIVGHLLSTPAASRGLDIAGFVLLVAGCAAAGAAILRTSNDDWDVAPEGPPTAAGTASSVGVRPVTG